MPRRNSRYEPEWVSLKDEELLEWRFSELDLQIEGSVLEERIERLYEELEARSVRVKPHCWLSEEWFSPDGIPGIAIPFYLAHPRLMKLEQRQMLEVEGGTREWCLRILRHEAGHAIDTAYRLGRRKQYQQMFGLASQRYPEYYNPKPYSRRFVVHLDSWYAQSHPVEDFAETFAVWLKPDSRWRRQYADWPAIKKLEYVDALMAELADEPPQVRSRTQLEPVSRNRKTLGEHYAEKRARYSTDYPDFYDRDLRRLFSDNPKYASRPSAAAFLRHIRPDIRQAVGYWTGEHQYIIDQVLRAMINRCRQLKLRLDRSERQTKQDAVVLLTVLTMNYLHDGHHRLAL